MQDPDPENIVGEKSVGHHVEWKVRPSLLIGVVAVLYLAHRFLGSSESEEAPISDVAQLGQEGGEVEIEVFDNPNGFVNGGSSGMQPERSH